MLVGIILWTTACSEKSSVEPQGKLPTTIQTTQAGDCVADHRYGSRFSQCTAGVRLWKGGWDVHENGVHKVYGGVPWSGDAKDWWVNGIPCGKRSKTPRKHAIVVFAGHSNSAAGHVGIVIKRENGVYWMKSRNAKGDGQDSEQTIKSYVKDNNTRVLGYIVYPR